MPALGRWASADPLAVHAPGSADLNVYAYVHGQRLRAVDPTGLDEENGTSGPPGGASNGADGVVAECEDCSSRTAEDSRRGYRENADAERSGGKDIAGAASVVVGAGVTTVTKNPAAGAIAATVAYAALGGVASEADTADLVPILATGLLRGKAPSTQAVKAGPAVQAPEAKLVESAVAESEGRSVGAASRFDPVFAGIQYGERDALGRPTSASALLTPSTLSGGSDAATRIRPPGFTNGFVDNRSHLIAKLFGGSGSNPENLVAGFRAVNQIEMKGFGMQIFKALKQGESIAYCVEPVYSGAGLRPVGITLQAEGSRGFELSVSVLNIP